MIPWNERMEMRWNGSPFDVVWYPILLASLCAERAEHASPTYSDSHYSNLTGMNLTAQVQSGSGMSEQDPGAWLLPYWMARYHGILSSADTLGQ